MSMYEKLKAAMRFDGWQNPFTGVGTLRDKSSYSTFGVKPLLSPQACEILYHFDDVAARICDAVPEEALKKGIVVNVTEKSAGSARAEHLEEIESDIAAELDRLEVVPTFTEAAIWGFVFGGCVIRPELDDGVEGDGLATPVNPATVKAIRNLTVYDLRYVTPTEFYEDSADQKCGEPMVYQITPPFGGSYRIHESRLIVFGGERTSRNMKSHTGGWDFSKLQRCHEVIEQFGTSWATLSTLIADARQGVFKMAGLIDALAMNEEDLIQKRMALMDMSRSSTRALVLDAESEDFTYTPFSWSGVKEPYNLLIMRLCLAAKMPATVLFGKSPDGLNASGEGDTTNWYDQLEAYQTLVLKPRFETLISLLLQSKEGPAKGREPENWAIVFPSLWTLTPKETAEQRKSVAETDRIYIDSEVLLPEEVAVSRFGPEGWSMETTIDLEAREQLNGLDDTPPVPPIYPDPVPEGFQQAPQAETDELPVD